jgi:hypothetical protein
LYGCRPVFAVAMGEAGGPVSMAGFQLLGFW